MKIFKKNTLRVLTPNKKLVSFFMKIIINCVIENITNYILIIIRKFLIIYLGLD